MFFHTAGHNRKRASLQTEEGTLSWKSPLLIRKNALLCQLASSNISPSTMRTVRCAHFATFRPCVREKNAAGTATSAISSTKQTAGGSIHAALSRKKHLTLTVTNDCRNVDSIRLDRLFDRFYREDAARTAGSGFGIGLSIAQSIAERHRGSIKAYKADDGVIGFAVKLPLN